MCTCSETGNSRFAHDEKLRCTFARTALSGGWSGCVGQYADFPACILPLQIKKRGKGSNEGRADEKPTLPPPQIVRTRLHFFRYDKIYISDVVVNLCRQTIRAVSRFFCFWLR